MQCPQSHPDMAASHCKRRADGSLPGSLDLWEPMATILASDDMKMFLMKFFMLTFKRNSDSAVECALRKVRVYLLSP